VNVPAWMFVSGLTLTFLYCVLNSNTRLWPLWSQTSAAGTTDSWMCLWRCGSWRMHCSQCCFDNNYIPSTPVPFLGLTDPVPSPTMDVMENTETEQVTDMVCEGFIRPGSVSCSWTWDRTPRDKENHTCLSLAKTWTHVHYRGSSPWDSCHQIKENGQQSHVLDHSTAFPIELIPVWGENSEIPRG
jgi:hypothetical protein